jgi:hypothetical protein
MGFIIRPVAIGEKQLKLSNFGQIVKQKSGNENPQDQPAVPLR